MRLLQLLAIATVCPLGLIGTGCGRIVQPLGEYEAQSTQPPNSSLVEMMDATLPSEPPESTERPPSDGSEDPVPPVDAGAEDPSQPRTPAFPGTTPTNPIRIPAITIPTVPTRPACEPTMRNNAIRKRLDMYIMMDANITLPYQGIWEFAIGGVREFVNDYRSLGTGVGLRFYGQECEPESYDQRPTVEVRVLPANLDSLNRATMIKGGYTASPMEGALIGAIQHQTKRASEYPEAKQIVVMVTDGVAQDVMCRYTANDVEAAARAGFASSSIETYVIGFGYPDTGSVIANEIIERFSPLDAIAVAGGTRTANIVKTRQESTPMSEALQRVRRIAQPCEYEVPSDFDPANLNLEFSRIGMVPRVDARESCGQRSGFFYHYDPETNLPTALELCPVTCATIAGDDYTATLLGGCPTLRR